MSQNYLNKHFGISRLDFPADIPVNGHLLLYFMELKISVYHYNSTIAMNVVKLSLFAEK